VTADPLSETKQYTVFLQMTYAEVLGSFRGEVVNRTTDLYYNLLVSIPTQLLISSDVNVYSPIDVSAVIALEQ